MIRPDHSPNTMKVAVRIRRAVVVHDNVDTLNINTTPEDVGGDKDTLLKRLERLVAGDTVEHTPQSAYDGHLSFKCHTYRSSC